MGEGEMTQLIVDLGQLRDTCRAVQADTNHTLRDGFRGTDPKIHQGVPFGRSSPSGEVSAARAALTATLHRHVENSVAHLRRADQIITFLDHMLEEYSSVDELHAADLQTLLSKLDQALPAIPRNPSASGFQE
jgi:hypothetical protein